MEPAASGSGLVFDSICSEDVLDRNWQRPILTHLSEKAHRGVLMGAEITDMKITLAAGRAHLKTYRGRRFPSVHLPGSPAGLDAGRICAAGAIL